MTESKLANSSTPSDRAMRRRGLVALAAAFVGGLVAKRTETPLAAGTDGDVVLGSVGNKTATETAILNNASAGTGPAIHGFRSPGAVTAVPTTFDAGLVG